MTLDPDQSKSKVREHEYTRDGHCVDIVLSDGGGYQGRVICPGEKCDAQMPNGDCAIVEELNYVGMEFFEYQDRPYVEAALPCEIEWRWDSWGDEGAEFWWRAVPPADGDR